MAKSNKHAGQFNLRGKKTLLLRCKCCTVDDLRDKLLSKEAVKAVREVLAISSLS